MESYIRQGNCLEVMKDIPDKSIDMILCDLPYGTTKCKWYVARPIKFILFIVNGVKIYEREQSYEKDIRRLLRK